MVVTCKMTVMLLPLDNGGVVMGLYGGKMKIGDFLVKYGNVGYKTTVLTCQSNSERCDSLPKDLNLALASNKTNGGVKNN